MASPSATTSSSSPESQALDLLSPAQGILDLFAHRNKNQHRLSKWWAQFDMLRRGTRKLLADLQACADGQAKIAAAAAASSSGSSSGRSKKKQSAAALKRIAEHDALRTRMEVRARHVGGQIVPRAYLAFTQLAADNQYAHLGLALVGVLAQINAAISPLISTSPGEADGDDGLLVPGKTAEPGAAEGALLEVPDLGVAISRSEIEQRVSSGATDRRKERNAVEEDHVTDHGATRGEKVHRETETETETAANTKVKEAPRKSKKSRDEFDSLFGSLETKKPAKKKKRKMGDEFDTLFSSLL